MPNYKIKDSAEARKLAIIWTRLDEISSKISVSRCDGIRPQVPFITNKSTNNPLWCVKFDEVKLNLKSAVRNFEDKYAFQRSFNVLIDGITGQLVSITSTFNGPPDGMRPEPPASAAEAQLRSIGEIYHEVPLIRPQITFLDAIDGVLISGGGSPFFAKEIDGLYVLHSRRGSKPSPVWIVTLRGLPPISVEGPAGFGSGGIGIPVWQRNHMRNIVDAMTGACLFSTNVPQPE